MEIKPIPPEIGEKIAGEWGFPRPVTTDELAGEWYVDGHRAIFWLEPADLPSLWGIHIAVNPEFRSKWGGWFRALRFMEGRVDVLSGAKTGFLIVGRPCDGIEPYLGRLGFLWHQADGVWFKRIG